MGDDNKELKQMSSGTERRSIVQTARMIKGATYWSDGIGGNDVEAGRRVLVDLRKMYPRERFRLVQMVVEGDEVLT